MMDKKKRRKPGNRPRELTRPPHPGWERCDCMACGRYRVNRSYRDWPPPVTGHVRIVDGPFLLRFD